MRLPVSRTRAELPEASSVSSVDAHARACELFAGRHRVQARVRNADDHETDDVDTRIVTLRQRGHGAHGAGDQGDEFGAPQDLSVPAWGAAG